MPGDYGLKKATAILCIGMGFELAAAIANSGTAMLHELSFRRLPRYYRMREGIASKTHNCPGLRFLPKHIHAVTPEGFEFKTILFVLASTIDCLYAFE